MTPNQLPPLPEIDPVLDHPEHHMKWSRQEIAWIKDYATVHALAALAQQAQEPVAAALGDIVALWDKYAPSEYMTAIHMQAKRALAGQPPVSPDMHRWCAYVGGMVASWVTSEPDAHARLGGDKFEAAIAGIIERRLWAMPKRDTTPPAPQPDVSDGGDFFVLDDEAKAMIVNSHHYTPGNIQALIEQLAAFADPTKTTQADWDNLDWRGFCNVIQRVMMGLACDLQPAVPVVSEEQIESCALAAGFSIEPSTGAIWAVDGCGSTRVDPGLRKFARAILALRPAVEPMTPFMPSQRMRLWQNTEKGKSATSLGAFERICQTVEAAHRIGITAKAEGGSVMASLNEHHKTLNADGVGKCSVPMWCGGGPSGFCDCPAYGNRLPTRYLKNYASGYEYAEDGGYAGYVPALACPSHGGPKSRVFKDGDAWCAVLSDFMNIQESPCGFGSTPELARLNLTNQPTHQGDRDEPFKKP